MTRTQSSAITRALAAYPAQQSVAGRTHEQVKAELAEARASGWLNRHIGA
jgi:hypothetical protein